MTETSELSDAGAGRLLVAMFKRAAWDLRGKNEQRARNAELFLSDERTLDRLDEMGIDSEYFLRLLSESEMGTGRRRRRRGRGR